MYPYIDNNVLIDEAKKGLPYEVVVESDEIFLDFDEIEAELKYSKKMSATAALILTKGNGIEVGDGSLTLTLTSEQTKALSAQQVYLDVKARNTDTEPTELFSATIYVRETPTDL